MAYTVLKKWKNGLEFVLQRGERRGDWYSALTRKGVSAHTQEEKRMVKRLHSGRRTKRETEH